MHSVCVGLIKSVESLDLSLHWFSNRLGNDFSVQSSEEVSQRGNMGSCVC